MNQLEFFKNCHDPYPYSFCALFYGVFFHLQLSQVHDALSYYYENRDELDSKIEQDQKFIGQLKKTFPSKLAQSYGQT